MLQNLVLKSSPRQGFLCLLPSAEALTEASRLPLAHMQHGQHYDVYRLAKSVSVWKHAHNLKKNSSFPT